MAAVPNGIVFADSKGAQIKRLAGRDLALVAGTGLPGSSGDGGPSTQAFLDQPLAVAVDSGVTYLGLDRGIRVVEGGTIRTLVGDLRKIGGLAVCGGALYVSLYDANFGGARVIKYPVPCGTPETPCLLTHVAGTGSSNYSGDGGPAVSAALRIPRGLATAPDCTLYIADSGNHRIRRVGSDGIITTVAGGGAALGDGGPATEGRLQGPVAVALGGAGELYIADSLQHRIRLVRNERISSIAGTGAAQNLNAPVLPCGEPPITGCVKDPLTLPITLPTGVAVSTTTLWLGSEQDRAIYAVSLGPEPTVTVVAETETPADTPTLPPPTLIEVTMLPDTPTVAGPGCQPAAPNGNAALWPASAALGLMLLRICS